jgi:hypothetical protein
MQPRIGFGFVLRLLEVIQRFMHLLDRAKRPLNLACRTCVIPLTLVPAGRQVRPHLDAEVPHHALKHLTACDRTVVRVQHARNAS